MKRNLHFLMFLAILCIVSSCEKDSSSKPNDSITDDNAIISNNSEELSSRISLRNELMLVEDVPGTLLKSGQSAPIVDLTKNYTFTLRAEVSAPTYEGSTLMATHVKIVDNYAFVTYNTKGNGYLGGIEIFDVKDIRNPKIISRAIYPNEDISSVDYYNNKLYVVGAHDYTDKNSKFRSPAFLKIIPLNSDKTIPQNPEVIIKNLDSYAGTDVKVTEDAIYTISGSEGYLKVYNHDLDSIFSAPIKDARSVDINSGNVYVLSGQPGKVSVFNRSNNSLITAYSPSGANTPESKSEIAVSENYIYAALNEGGIKVLNLDGSLKQHIARPVTPAGENDEDYVTNSTSLNGDLLLGANGEAGLYIGGIVNAQHDSVFLLGAIKFGTDQSANFVESKDSVIFVATGLGGLKILALSIDEGVPDDIIPTKPCPTLLGSLAGLFPNSKDNVLAHSELFDPNNERNVVLTKEADVFITFVDEEAAYKNSLGYYTYSLDNPPTSSADFEKIEKHILYPNISEVGSGGALAQGDMVKIGRFPTGTVVGFYLITRGWRNGKVTKGEYIHYTNYEFNLGSKQQHTLFEEGQCNELVMTFEDLSLNPPASYPIVSDKDFNDLIFVITDNNDPKHATASTAFDLTKLPKK